LLPLIVLQDRDSQRAGERAKEIASLSHRFRIEVCKNADHQIGIVDLLRWLFSLLGDGVSFHGQSFIPLSSSTTLSPAVRK
jgi:hypothetical protein